ncbi:MAG: hypothetical protein KF810_03030 [Rhizobiaceae bacterium]|nr:hypothetical protein [Rhizobiaceae bacterium]
MTGPDQIELRLKWRRTWPDRENDFVGVDPISGKTIGRFHVSSAGNDAGKWIWLYQASFPGLPWAEIHRSGFEATPREAAKAIEDTWFRATEGKRFDPASGTYLEAHGNDPSTGL